MGNGQTPPAPPQGALPAEQPREVPCASCKKIFSFTPPQAEITNHRNYSQAMWVHESAARCPHCFQTHVFVVGQIQIGWMITPIKESQEEKRQIILPPSGLKV